MPQRLGSVLTLTFVALAAHAHATDLTFFAWSDQHVQTDGDWSHCEAAIEAFLSLPGTEYPEEIGGVVGEPEFVLGAGDATEWPTHDAVEGYKAILDRLPWPTYDIAGNHDDGGASPSDTFLSFIRDKHGGLDYSFDVDGVHFICLFTTLVPGATNPAGPVFPEQLRFLRAQLAELPEDKPVVVVMHHCADSLTNTGEVLESFAGRRVVLVLGGHYHKPVLTMIDDLPFHQLPSPMSDIPAVTVFRITEGRLLGLSWNYEEGEWMDAPRLDMPLPAGPREGIPLSPGVIDGCLYHEDFEEAPTTWRLNPGGLEGGWIDHGYTGSAGAFRVEGRAPKLGFVADLPTLLRPEADVWISFMAKADGPPSAMLLTGMVGGHKCPDWGLDLPQGEWAPVHLRTGRDISEFTPGETPLEFLTLWADDAESSGWIIDDFMISYYRPPVLSATEVEPGAWEFNCTPLSGVTVDERITDHRIVVTRPGSAEPIILSLGAEPEAAPLELAGAVFEARVIAVMESGAQWPGLGVLRVGQE